MKHISTRQLALCAVLTALALGLSTLENLFPVTLLIPLPGVKLGLANIVTVFALYQLGALPALAILTARCLLGSLFAGNASAMLFSDHFFRIFLNGFASYTTLFPMKIKNFHIGICGNLSHSPNRKQTSNGKE